MRTILVLVLALALPSWAGTSDAIITGKTSSGRTELEVHVSDVSDFIRYVKLTIDGKTYELKEDEVLASVQTVISDHENGVYVLFVKSGTRHFKLWMIPGSEKVLAKGSGYYRSRFAAVLEATDPRKPGKTTPRITIGCKLDYSI